MSIAPIRPHRLLTFIEQEIDRVHVRGIVLSDEKLLGMVERLNAYTKEMRAELFKLEEGILVEQLEASLEAINRSPEAQRRCQKTGGGE